jgi:hypothetical protein
VLKEVIEGIQDDPKRRNVNIGVMLEWH